MSELLTGIITYLKEHYMITILVVGCFIQISPVQVYPFNWIKHLFNKGVNGFVKYIASEITKDLKPEIDIIKRDLSELTKKVDTMEITSIEKEKKEDNKRMRDLKWKILNFADIVKDNFCKKEQFDSIYDDNLEYHTLIRKYNLPNGQVDRAMATIDRYYEIYKEDDNF